MAKPDTAAQTDKQQLAARRDQLIAMTDSLCDEQLNDEYKALCRKVIEKLSRKRPSPLMRGKPQVWAAGVVHAIGTINFLFDNSLDPFMPSPEIAFVYGVAASTMSNKSHDIRKMLKIDFMSLDYLTSDLRERQSELLQTLQYCDGVISSREQPNVDRFENDVFYAKETDVFEKFEQLYTSCKEQGLTQENEIELRSIINNDPEYYDPYVLMYQLLPTLGRTEDAIQFLKKAFMRAVQRLQMNNGQLPRQIPWEWEPNRPILYVFFLMSKLYWIYDETERASDLFKILLFVNPSDFLGARYCILALKMEMTYDAYNAQYGLLTDETQLQSWFSQNARAYMKEFNWYFDLLDNINDTINPL